MPHQTVDTIPISAALVSAIQSSQNPQLFLPLCLFFSKKKKKKNRNAVVSRGVNPLNSVVVTVGVIQGGYGPNVIAGFLSSFSPPYSP